MEAYFSLQSYNFFLTYANIPLIILHFLTKMPSIQADKYFTKRKTLFVNRFSFWKTFCVYKNCKLHIMSEIRFCFG